jgi:hypothetical protein
MFGEEHHPYVRGLVQERRVPHVGVEVHVSPSGHQHFLEHSGPPVRSDPRGLAAFSGTPQPARRIDRRTSPMRARRVASEGRLCERSWAAMLQQALSTGRAVCKQADPRDFGRPGGTDDVENDAVLDAGRGADEQDPFGPRCEQLRESGAELIRLESLRHAVCNELVRPDVVDAEHGVQGTLR